MHVGKGQYDLGGMTEKQVSWSLCSFQVSNVKEKEIGVNKMKCMMSLESLIGSPMFILVQLSCKSGQQQR